MCALLPRIFRFRSALNPPMTLMAPESENDARATREDRQPADEREKPALLRAHVPRGDVRRERPALEPVEHPRQERHHRADEEQHAVTMALDAHERVPQRPRRAAQHRQVLRPVRDADEDGRRSPAQTALQDAARRLLPAEVDRRAPDEERDRRRPRRASPASDQGEREGFTSAGRPGPPRAAAGGRG